MKRNELIVHSIHGQSSKHYDEQKQPDTRKILALIPFTLHLRSDKIVLLEIKTVIYGED